MTDFPNWYDEISAPARKVFPIVAGASPIVDSDGKVTILKGLRAAGAGSVTIKTIESPAGCVHPVLDGERIDARITHVTAVTGVTGLIGYA